MSRSAFVSSSIAIASALFGLARAAPVEFAVQYFDPSIFAGPLSFDLAALPTEVTGRFQFDTDDVAFDVATGLRQVDLGDIRAAHIKFGDGVWTDLNAFSFSYAFSEGTPVFVGLTYSFSPIDTLTAASAIVSDSNFVLRPSGIDRATGESFEYRYNGSRQTLNAIAVPEPSTWLLAVLGIGISSASPVLLRRRRVARQVSKKYFPLHPSATAVRSS